MDRQQPASDSSSYKKIGWWLGLLFCLLITVISLWVAFNPKWVQQFGRWGYLGAALISLITSATIFLPAPGIAIVIAMGSALDPIYLSLAAGLGSALGELTGYIAGATGRTLIPQEHQERFESLQQLVHKYNVLLLAVLAAIPFPFFDLAGIIAGIIRMRVITFIIAVAIGKSIRYFFFIWISTSSLEWVSWLWH